MNTTQNTSFTDAEGKNNLNFSENTKLIEKIDIANSPLKRIITDEGDFFTIGQKAITKKLTKKEADKKQKEIEKHDWKLLLSIISVIVQETTAQLHLDMMSYAEKMENITKEN